MTTVPLPGCSPEPLIGYLKALGVLRMVSQSDEDARAFWRNGQFVLRSTFDQKGLLNLFLSQYRPTPILAPWNAGCGLFKKWDEKAGGFKSREAVEALDRIAASNSSRLAPYRLQIQRVKHAMSLASVESNPGAELENLNEKAVLDGWSKKRLKEEKASLLGSVLLFESEGATLKLDKADKDEFLLSLRSTSLGDEGLLWLDASFALLTGRKKNRAEAPILGSGGNVGNSDFSAMFVGMLPRILELVEGGQVPEESSALLEAALFAQAVPGLLAEPVGQFDPGKAGGANMSQAMEGSSTVNPWDFVLMVEGVLLLSGSVTTRLGASASASFPFTVRSSAIGYASAGKDEDRGETWLPLWERASSIAELKSMFSEGRAQVSRRRAATAVDFARAAARLGVDRGITSFVRYGFQARLGDNYLASPLGRVSVQDRREVDLLDQIDRWLDSFRRACDDTKQPAPERFKVALRQIDRAIFEFCQYGGPQFFQSILKALGHAEAELGSGERFRVDGQTGRVRVRPLSGLSPDWISAAADGSPEFEVALALAGIFDDESKVGPLRANLEPVDSRSGRLNWAERDRRVVWNSGNMIANLSAVLARRLMDGGRAGCVQLPFDFVNSASPRAIADLLAGTLDESRIEHLLWGLMLVDHRQRETKVQTPVVLFSCIDKSLSAS